MLKTKSLWLLKQTKITRKVKKNLRVSPNNSLLQRPSDGRAHYRNVRGGANLAFYKHIYLCKNIILHNNNKHSFIPIYRSRSITNQYNTVYISIKLRVS